MKKINEYKTQPVLSERASNFIYNTDSGDNVPDDIRAELEKYVKDMEPFADNARLELVNQFKRVFNK
jgi:hypothetical protein